MSVRWSKQRYTQVEQKYLWARLRSVAIHFLHIRKSGGTAIKYALKQANARSNEPLPTPLGDLILHPHSFKLEDVPEGDQAIFSVRDPASRFVSGFYSRLRKGAPRYNREWSDAERRCFGWFSTPQELADALTKRWGPKRKKAEFAMNSIRHLRRPMIWWTGEAPEFSKRLSQVVYIARQETLDEDFARLKSLLDLPADLELPSDPVQAHRYTGPNDKSLTPKMVDALREWYAADYALLEVCEQARGEILARQVTVDSSSETSEH
jgi:hypothetical protein